MRGQIWIFLNGHCKGNTTLASQNWLCSFLSHNSNAIYWMVMFSDYSSLIIYSLQWRLKADAFNKMVREQKNTFKEETELIPSKSTSPVLDSHRVLRFVNEVPRSLFMKKKKTSKKKSLLKEDQCPVFCRLSGHFQLLTSLFSY